MAYRSDRQVATIDLMLDIADRMAAQTQRIARRDIVDLGAVALSSEERERLAQALRHIDQAAADLGRRLRGEVVAAPE